MNISNEECLTDQIKQLVDLFARNMKIPKMQSIIWSSFERNDGSNVLKNMTLDYSPVKTDVYSNTYILGGDIVYIKSKK